MHIFLSRRAILKLEPLIQARVSHGHDLHFQC